MRITTPDQIVLDALATPETRVTGDKPIVPGARYAQRLDALRAVMSDKRLDTVVVYADREHYANFRYFMGFDPRFEEALLVVGREDAPCLLLGNECLNLHKLAHFPVRALLCRTMSLPNQPMDGEPPMEELLARAGVTPGTRVGAIGWKMFTDAMGAVRRDLLCVPEYIAAPLRALVGADGTVVNAADILIHPEYGLRVSHDADTIAAFEYGAALASDGMIRQMETLAPGMTEMEICNLFQSNGQVETAYRFALAGENANKGLINASDYAIRLGDDINLSCSLEGGLSCRHAYVARDADDLPEHARDYVERMVKPYYAAVTCWYENIAIGTNCGDIYDLVERILPKAQFGWTINTGHLLSNEEWLSSPFYHGSKCAVRSGMLLQMDIIPDVPGYSGPNAEDGVCVADRTLRAELARRYPAVYERMQARRAYMTEMIGMRLPEEVLPMSDLAGLFRPYMLNRALGMRVQHIPGEA